MKKFLKTATLFCFLGLLSSCGDEDQVIYSDDNGFALVGLTTNSAKLPVYEDPARKDFYEIEVGVTNRVGYDRVIGIDIVEDLTTATDAMYDIDEATLVIPANSFVGKIKVKGFFDPLAAGEVQLVIDIASVQDANTIDPLKQRFFLKLFQGCDFLNFPLTYDVDVYAFGDQAPSHVVTFNAVADEMNTYRILSSWGPNFVAWAANYPPYANAYLNPGTLSINCDFSVDFTGSYSTGTGFYDEATGVINIVINQNLFTSPFNTELVFIPQE